jgi:hypothetical protein
MAHLCLNNPTPTPGGLGMGLHSSPLLVPGGNCSVSAGIFMLHPSQDYFHSKDLSRKWRSGDG